MDLGRGVVPVLSSTLPSSRSPRLFSPRPVAQIVTGREATFSALAHLNNARDGIPAPRRDLAPGLEQLGNA